MSGGKTCKGIFTVRKALFLISFLFTGILAYPRGNGVYAGIGLQTGGGAYLIIPEIVSYLSVPVSFEDRFVLSPKVGFSYLFNVMGETHSALYLPVAVDLVLPAYNLGFSVKYFFSFSSFSAGGTVVTMAGLVPLTEKGKFRFFLQFELGAAAFFTSEGVLSFFPVIQPSLALQYFFSNPPGNIKTNS